MKKMIGFFWNSLLKRTIVRTILVSYLAVNVLLLFLLGILAIRDSTSTITKEITQSNYRIMEQAALGFSSNLEEAKRPLVLLAGNASVLTLMLSNGGENIEEKLQYERNVADLNFGFNSFQSLISYILILGKSGYVNNLDGRKTLKWDYSFNKQPWFKTAIQSDPSSGFITLGIHKQDYYLSTILSKVNQPTLSIALPVIDYQHRIIGAIVANLDLEKINGLFKLGSFQNNENIFMIDDKRNIIVHRDKTLIGEAFSFPGIDKIYQSTSGSFITHIEGKSNLVIFHPTAVQGWRMISTIPMSEIYEQSKPLESKLLGFLFLCLLLNILISILITIRISRPVNRLLNTLYSTGEESLYVIKKNYKYRELNHIGNKFQELMGRIEILIKQNYLSTIAMKEIEIKTLQSQINPHFLFNTLQLLQTEIVCGNTDDSNHLVLSLSNLLRYSMKQSEDIVELNQELQNVKDYLFILERKFDNRIVINYVIPDMDVLNYMTPKLILQPIVENAIKHGFQENPQMAQIQIGIVSVKRGILISIKDNGIGISKKQMKMLLKQLDKPDSYEDNIGLNNVNQRIKLKYGERYGLILRSKESAYMNVFVVLPRLTK